MADDPYAILGVPKGASEDDIRRAIRKLAKELHPDLNPKNGVSTEERFKKVSSAYQILGDPEKRKAFDRGEQSLNLLAHAGLAGIDHPGRVFIALAIYYRHEGSSQIQEEALSERLKALVSRRVQKRARIVAAAIRTAHMLSIGVAGVIDETPLSYEGNKLVLSIPKAYAGLDGERLHRRFEALAELLDCQPELRILP